ncbi:DUF895 domain membrane protein, partial [Cladochytrium tenue]
MPDPNPAAEPAGETTGDFIAATTDAPPPAVDDAKQPAAVVEVEAAIAAAGAADPESAADAPKAGWMYRPLVGSKYYYASPLVQLIIVAFVCFLCPGMFNALNGLGGGGQVDQTAADNANTALYTTFAIF